MRRSARTCLRRLCSAQSDALSVSAGEIYQFDWSQEVVLLGGTMWE
jgi:hypothetical protein